MNNKSLTGKIITLKNGEKGKVIGQLTSGQWILIYGHGGHAIGFHEKDILEVEE